MKCLVVATWFLFGACCPGIHSGAEGPEGVVRAFAGHLHQKAPEAAWNLLSDEARREMRPSELVDLAVPTSAEDGARIEWQNAPPGEGGLILVRERGAWRVAAFVAETPTRALAGFLLAIEKGDCRALLRYSPPETLARHPADVLKRGCESDLPELKRCAGLLRAAGATPVLLSEDRAVLPYDKVRKLTLVRIGRRWYVEDL